jgi:hypothetical protein
MLCAGLVIGLAGSWAWPLEMVLSSGTTFMKPPLKVGGVLLAMNGTEWTSPIMRKIPTTHANILNYLRNKPGKEPCI